MKTDGTDFFQYSDGPRLPIPSLIPCRTETLEPIFHPNSLDPPGAPRWLRCPPSPPSFRTRFRPKLRCVIAGRPWRAGCWRLVGTYVIKRERTLLCSRPPGEQLADEQPTWRLPSVGHWRLFAYDARRTSGPRTGCVQPYWVGRNGSGPPRGSADTTPSQTSPSFGLEHRWRNLTRQMQPEATLMG